MDQYHFQRPEKMITDRTQLVQIIKEQQYLTLAMCKDNQPYLVTLNYAFDDRRNCFYIHCAHKGKKLEYLYTNPEIWGQIVQDHGYRHGECDHAYRTVHFKGLAETVTDEEEIRYAFHLMIDQLEVDPEPVKQRFASRVKSSAATIIRIQVQGMSGKGSV